MSDLIERLRNIANRQSSLDGVTCRDAANQIEDDRVTIINLEARLRIETKRADDAEARETFLITELDKLIEKAKQS